MTKRKLNSYASLFLLSLVFSTLLTLWWPGIMRPDSLNQLAQAQTGHFNDANPPIMAFLWRAFSYFSTGPAPLLTFHLGLFFITLTFFQRSMDGKLKYFYALVPLFPHVLCYSGFVLKDIGFTYSFLLCFAVLAHHTIQKRPLSILTFMGISLLLFYGSAVKYQGIFIMPVACLWIMSVQFRNMQAYKRMLLAALLATLFVGGVTLFNSLTTSEKSHYWQFVKIYDLAGISLETGRNYLPEFTKTEHFSIGKMKEKYNTFRVDEMVNDEPPILIKSTIEAERNELWMTWFKTVMNEPLSYLVHRGRIMLNQLTISPLKKLDDIKNSADEITSNVQKIMHLLDKLGIFDFLKVLTTFLYFLPVSITYFFLGLRAKAKWGDSSGTVLSFLNGSGLLLIGILFIFSMAAEARYIYLSVCCFHLSHPFAYLCLKNGMKKWKTT